MLAIRNILVPLDFSDRSVGAAEHAVELAKKFHSKLHFAHFIPPPPHEYAAFNEGFYASSSWPNVEERRALERRMDEVLAKVRPVGDVEKTIARGEPAYEIEALIRQKAIDLAVMPTHGYGPFRRFLLGSVVSKVLHDVKIPVFTGTHLPELTPLDPDPYKRIACAIDLRDHSEDVLRWAWDLAKACHEDLIVINAAPRLDVGALEMWLPAGEALEKCAREAVQRMIGRVGCRAEVHVASADPTDYIAQVAESSYADILVIGRHAQSGPLKGLREHAMSIIREAPCPVISV
jgi:nucleotide-binding universal stress UspA family protein